MSNRYFRTVSTLHFILLLLCASMAYAGSAGMPGGNVRVSSLKFFEGGYDADDPGAYATEFPKSKTRYIYWKLDMEFPPPERTINGGLEAFWYDDRGLMWKDSMQIRIEADWDHSSHWQAYPVENAEFSWDEGKYSVDVYAGGHKLSSGAFEIYDDVCADYKIGQSDKVDHYEDLTETYRQKKDSKNYTISRQQLAMAYLDRGASCMFSHKKQAAIEAFSKVLEIDPRNSVAYNNRATVKLMKGDPAGALPDINRAIELAPKNADFYCTRAKIRHSLGDDESAVDDLDEAIDLNPREPEFYYIQALDLESLGYDDDAIDDLRTAADLCKSCTEKQAIADELKKLLGK